MRPLRIPDGEHTLRISQTTTMHHPHEELKTIMDRANCNIMVGGLVDDVGIVYSL